jgi:peptidoglycan/xylan/chitin deacetylase (PgdA/CDA1 family)
MANSRSVDERLGAPRMKSLSRMDATTSEKSRATPDTTEGAPWWRRRLARSRLRSKLRARPRMQGRVLAPAGMFKRLPQTAGLYFPFYHDVLPCYADDLRRHLVAFRQIGPMVSWDEALAVLEGRRELAGPVFCLSFDDGHPTWRDVVVPLLRELGVPATFFVTTTAIDQEGGLSWQDCRQMAAQGFSFGSHTITHRHLSEMDDGNAAREIFGSKAEIEDRIGVEVKDFAAPYGRPGVDFLDRDVRLVREAGYRSFATTLREPMHGGDSPMWIQRQGLHPAWPLWAVRTRVHD